MASSKAKTRLQRKREKESLKQALKYIFLILLMMFLMIKFGLPGLIKMATFIGNLNSSSKPIENEETTAPMTPRLRPILEATTSASLNISGYGESGSVVELYLRGMKAEESVVDNDGSFLFKNIHIKEGENEIYVLARNESGNKSSQSESFTIILDNTSPVLSLESPKDGDRFFDQDNPITVTGISEVGASLTVNSHFVMLDSEGKFETKVSLNEGDNEIEAVAKDQAGNETRQKVTVNYMP